MAVVASSDKAKAQKVVDKITKAGGTALALTADVTKAASVNAAVATAEKELGPIDVLICSAGVFTPTPIGETPEQDYDNHNGHQCEGQLERDQRRCRFDEGAQDRLDRLRDLRAG